MSSTEPEKGGSLARAAEKAYLTVRERILSGAYPASMRLTEQQIAAASGVSRTPVREALRRLQAEGYVTASANHGALVVEWTADEINDIFELRILLEPYSAARAATRIDAQGIARLRDLAERQRRECETRGRGYIERIGELNGEFHRLVHTYSGNTRMIKLLPILVEAPIVFKTFAHYTIEELLRSSQHHLDLVGALEAHDPEWASSVMRTHVLAARNRRL